MMTRFNRLFRLALLTAGATFMAGASMAAEAPAAQGTSAEMQDLAQQINMYAGQVKVLPIGNIKRVALGNGKLVSVKRVGHQLILIGQAPGATNMLLWDRHGGVQAYNIMVDATDAKQNSANLAAALADVPGLEIHGRGGRVVLSGDVTTEDAKRIDKIVQGQHGIINLTHAQSVDMKRMVYLDVQVVDFKKSALRNIGIKWQNLIAGPVIGIVKDWQNNPYYRIGDLKQGGNVANQFQGPGGTLTALPVQTNYLKYMGITTSLSSVINLAAQNGDAYILANPQLSTRSGGDAKFLAGGEIPIPISSVLGQSSVQYKQYGVQLNIKPMADSHGNVLADIDTEVSQIDPSVTVDGYPGFLTRKTTSVVNVKSGQTIVLSGLIQATGAKTLDKFPWLGDIPILGALFRSKNFQSNRSELVIFVTPKIFTPESEVNRRAVDRGVEMVNGFNKTYGKGLYMPGFGVGPTRNQSEQPPAADASKSSPSAPSALRAACTGGRPGRAEHGPGAFGASPGSGSGHVDGGDAGSHACGRGIADGCVLAGHAGRGCSRGHRRDARRCGHAGSGGVEPGRAQRARRELNKGAHNGCSRSMSPIPAAAATRSTATRRCAPSASPARTSLCCKDGMSGASTPRSSPRMMVCTSVTKAPRAVPTSTASASTARPVR